MITRTKLFTVGILSLFLGSSAFSAIWSNKFTSNPNPEAIGWTNNSTAGINGNGAGLTNGYQKFGIGVNYKTIVVSNGVLTVPAYNLTDPGYSGNWPGIFFNETNGQPVADIYTWGDQHNGSGAELRLEASANVQIAGGLNGDTTAGVIKLGSSDYDQRIYANYFRIESQVANKTNWNDNITAFPYGHSLRLAGCFEVYPGGSATHVLGEAGFLCYPASTNLFPTGTDWSAQGIVRCYSSLPDGYSYLTHTFSWPGVWEWEASTNSMLILGKIIEEQKTFTISATNFALNFNAAQVVTLNSGVSSVSFYTTNTLGNAINALGQTVPANTRSETRNFVIRANGIAQVSLSYPAGWCVEGSTAGTSLPTNLLTGQLMRLRLQSVGIGETSILASATLANDNAFSWDSDALNYFTRASITNQTEKAALNQLVVDLKSASLWTNVGYALYPMLGGTSNSCAQNLLTNGWNITWHGQQASNFTSLGVFGNIANTFYGDTTFTASTVVSLNSFAMYVYNRTTLPVDNSGFMGTDNNVYSHLRVVSGQLESKGPNGTAPNYVNVASDFRGSLITSRTASNSGFTGSSRVGNVTWSNSSTSIDNVSTFIFVRDGGFASDYSDANIAGVAIYKGLSQADFANLHAAMNSFNTTLGRNAP